MSSLKCSLVKLLPNKSKVQSKKKAKPVLAKEICFKQGQTLQINLKTRFKKQCNHFVYGDKIEQILNQVHQFYEKKRFLKKNQNIYSEEVTLIKVLKLPLGNKKLLKNQQYLKQSLYPQMNELRELIKRKNSYSFVKNYMEVKWNDSTIQKIKTKYLINFQNQLFQRYKDVRQIFANKWRSYQKLCEENKIYAEKEYTERLFNIAQSSHSFLNRLNSTKTLDATKFFQSQYNQLFHNADYDQNAKFIQNSFKRIMIKADLGYQRQNTKTRKIKKIQELSQVRSYTLENKNLQTTKMQCQQSNNRQHKFFYENKKNKYFLPIYNNSYQRNAPYKAKNNTTNEQSAVKVQLQEKKFENESIFPNKLSNQHQISKKKKCVKQGHISEKQLKQIEKIEIEIDD